MYIITLKLCLTIAQKCNSGIKFIVISHLGAYNDSVRCQVILVRSLGCLMRQTAYLCVLSSASSKSVSFIKTII